MTSSASRSLPKCLQSELVQAGWSPPLDMLDLATRLEIEGVTDSAARSDYGFDSTCRMAETFFPVVRALQQPLPTRIPEFHGWTEYAKGISFALPLLFCCMSTLFLNFSLWGGSLTIDLASAVGLGIIASLIVSGGFVQAMARRGLFYSTTGQWRSCAHSTWRFTRLGILFLVLSGLAGTVASSYFGWLPAPLDAVALGFYFSLGLFWLATGILYMLGRNLAVAATTLIGLGVVALLYRAFRIDLLAAQLCGIFAAAGFAFAISLLFLNRNLNDKNEVVRRQSAGHVLYFLWPYFAYGCLYYVFLFCDRVLAWTARTESALLPLQFRGDYESALDVALFAFILQVGWVQSAARGFYRDLQVAQNLFEIDQVRCFNQRLRVVYWKKALAFMPLATVSSVVVYKIAMISGFLAGPTAPRVAIWALLGYTFLVFGLWNVALLFSLSRPLLVLKSIVIACFTDIVSGYLFSRAGSYHHAIIGFTAAALIFAALSSYHLVRTFRRLDYYYFASL